MATQGWHQIGFWRIRFDSFLNGNPFLLHQETPGLVESFGQQVPSRSSESRTGEDALGPPEEGEVRSWGRPTGAWPSCQGGDRRWEVLSQKTTYLCSWSWFKS